MDSLSVCVYFFVCFYYEIALINVAYLNIRASLAPRNTLFFYTNFTQGQKDARVLQALCKS